MAVVIVESIYLKVESKIAAALVKSPHFPKLASQNTLGRPLI